jgi:hypothetical protein
MANSFLLGLQAVNSMNAQLKGQTFNKTIVAPTFLVQIGSKKLTNTRENLERHTVLKLIYIKKQSVTMNNIFDMNLKELLNRNTENADSWHGVEIVIEFDHCNKDNENIANDANVLEKPGKIYKSVLREIFTQDAQKQINVMQNNTAYHNTYFGRYLADEYGMHAIKKILNHEIITECDYTWEIIGISKQLTLREIFNFANSFNKTYSMASNNSQHFVRYMLGYLGFSPKELDNHLYRFTKIQSKL